MASDASDIDDELLIFEDTMEILTASYDFTDPIDIITTPASDDEWDKLGVNPPALTADEKWRSLEMKEFKSRIKENLRRKVEGLKK